MCQLLLPLALLRSKSCLEHFRRRLLTLCAWTTLRQLGQGHQGAAHHMITYCLLIARSFSSYLPPVPPGIVWTLGILRVNITDVYCWTCLVCFLNPSLWHKKTGDYFNPKQKKAYFASRHDHGRSFPKLVELMDIFCFKWKSSCWINGAHFSFKENLFLSQLGSFWSILSPFFFEFDLAPLKIVYSTCFLSFPRMLSSVLFIVSSASLPHLHQLSLLVLGA